MSDSQTMTRDDISAAIAEKAWKDATFHKEILANPNAAYEKYLGRPVPNGVTIKVVEDTPSTVHFVIPAKPANAGELSDAELEDVAGGATPATILIVTAILPIVSTTLKASQVSTKKNHGW